MLLLWQVTGIEDAVKTADAALYAAKAGGKNRCYIGSTVPGPGLLQHRAE